MDDCDQMQTKPVSISKLLRLETVPYILFNFYKILCTVLNCFNLNNKDLFVKHTLAKVFFFLVCFFKVRFNQ